MKHSVSPAIVLTRVNYGEADRIITFLTPNDGKVSVMARGVRRQKSKLAGGIELFSVSTISYMPGKGQVSRLISARLDRHFGDIVSQVERVQLGYSFLQKIHRATEDAAEVAYFDLLETALGLLADLKTHPDLVNAWFLSQILQLGGYAPRLDVQANGAAFSEDMQYVFDYDKSGFVQSREGQFSARHIKMLRLLTSVQDPVALKHIQGGTSVAIDLRPLLLAMHTSYIRV